MGLERATILFVEDSQTTATPILSYLSHFFDVTYIETGKGALDLLGKHKYEILVVNYGLPDMDGPDVIHQCNQLNSPDFVVLTSGWHEDTDQVSDYFLPKPYSPGKLVDAITDHLQHRNESEHALCSA